MSDKPKIAMKIVQDGKVREISFEELALSNNLAQEALVRLIVKKKLFTVDELMKEMGDVQKERYRTGDPSKEK